MTKYEQCYQKTMEALTQYIKENKKIPTERVWNKIATKSDLLTSQTLGYLYGAKFPELCKELYTKIQTEKGDIKNEHMA